MIEALDLPKANLRLRRKSDVVYVWCIIRKKELLCTPEEWVRQHIIHDLIDNKSIPIGLISSEFALNYNGRAKRADIVVFDRDKKPLMIIECKATNIAITEETLFQIAQYNFELRVPYLMMSNGLNHVYCELKPDVEGINYLEEFPKFSF
ncbi:MAG: type I restriction enzyme HsdR N-terminal domain-containing protein [Crocinitomicaceae bacterium]